MSLFDDPRVIEAGARAIYSKEGAHHVTPGFRHMAGRVLNAALAALPRAELIERVARAVSIQYGRADPNADDRLMADIVLSAIGLIPEHVTPEEKR